MSTTSSDTARRDVDARGTTAPSSRNGAEAVDVDGTALASVQATDHDPVNSPSHYTVGGIETRDFIAAKNLNWDRGSAVKYIVRAGLKDPAKEAEDIEKAISCLKHDLARLHGQPKLPTPVYSCTFPTDPVSVGLRELERVTRGVVQIDLSDVEDAP